MGVYGSREISLNIPHPPLSGEPPFLIGAFQVLTQDQSVMTRIISVTRDRMDKEMIDRIDTGMISS